MSDLLSSVLVFVLLAGSGALGHLTLGRLPETHRSRETVEFTRLIAGMLVTFTALVLGLLTASVNTSFEKAGTDVQAYASDIIRLTSALNSYGSATAPIRADLRAYTAAAIATTWPGSLPGPRAASAPDAEPGIGLESIALGALLHRIEANIRALDPAGPTQAEIRALCLARFEALLDQRWMLIGDANNTITMPFYRMMVFWLCVVFASFGMSAPRNGVAAVFILLVALSVAGAVYVILELDDPLDGLVEVSDQPLRNALDHLDTSLTMPSSP